MANHGQDVFQQRLARIQAGKFSRVPQPGVAEENVRSWTTKHTKVNDMEDVVRRGGPIVWLLGFVLGIVAFGLSQLISFHFAGLPDPSMTAEMRMLVDVLFALGALLSFSLLFDLPGRMQMLFKLMGIAVAMVTMHNAVYMAPDLFESAFSWEWVRFIKAVSEPNSILVAGETIKLF